MNLPQVSSGAEIIEAVIAKGDLARLTPAERNAYYLEVCRTTGLNPITQPFAYIPLNGKLTLYAKRDAADQLRKNNGVSIEVVSHKLADGVLTVHVKATDRSGRVDEDYGVVALPDVLKGEARANAFLKAVTKAKRRVTLSICGLGLPDESEIEDIPHRPMAFDRSTGEIIQSSAGPSAEQPAPSRSPTLPAESGAGDNDDSRGEFIEACRDRIRRSTDYQELGAWWNSDEQKRARRDFDLTREELEDLMSFVSAKLSALKSAA